MVAPEAPDDESLRLELQEALVTYRQWASQFIQATGILIAADVALVSYAVSLRIAVIILVGTVLPIAMVITWMITASDRPAH